MKIFEMNEMDWVAAPSAAEAAAWYNDVSGLDEVTAEEIKELSDGELDTLQLSEVDDEGEVTKKQSFRQSLDARIAEKKPFPMLFATTES